MMSENTITRRAALRSGTLAALAAGLLGAAPTAPTVEAAPASEPSPRVVVVYVDDLAAESRRLAEMARDTQAAMITAGQDLKARLGADAYQLVVAYMEGPFTDHAVAYHDLIIAEIIRHTPALAPTIRLAWQHAIDGSWEDAGVCCTGEA